jgi:Rieske Fe-S protein
MKNVFLATGDSGMGMTHGTIAGMLLADLVHGRENPWAALYDPSRLPMKAVGELASEGVSTALPYTDWLTGGDVKSVGDIQPGQGAVVRRGLTKLAVYRDDAGSLHACSAVCPHLGAIVRWNPAERTWDCPAHGSRYTATGVVFHGPAHCGLGKAELEVGSPGRPVRPVRAKPAVWFGAIDRILIAGNESRAPRLARRLAERM